MNFVDDHRLDCLDENAVMDYLSGALSPGATAQLELHIDDCADCRSVLSESARLFQDVRDNELPTLDTKRYVVLGEHARGGQGQVLLAFDRGTGREVALKRLESTDEAHRSRFIRAARIASQLDHPHILQVHEVGYDTDKTPYITMPLVRGQTLTERLEAAVKLEDRLKLLVHFVDVCHAVAYAHSRGVIHRDIKPDNVMIGAFGETLLLDWGLATVTRVSTKPLDPAPLGPLDKTAEGVLLGTPAYMSPEQLSRGEVSERSDVWSLGVMLYELLCGARPFEGDLTGAQRAIVEGRYTAPRTRCPKLPKELAAVITGCLRVKPSARFERASQIAEELASYLAGNKVSVYDYSTLELFTRLVRRHTLSAALLLLTLLTLVGALGVSISFQKKERQARMTASRNLSFALFDRAQNLAAAKKLLSARLYAAASLVANPEAKSKTDQRAIEARSMLFQTDFDLTAKLEASMRLKGIATSVDYGEAGLLATSADGQIARFAKGRWEFLARDQGWISRAFQTPLGVLAISTGKVVRIDKGRARELLALPSGAALAVSPQGLFATGSDDGRIRLFKSNGEARAVLQGHQKRVMALEFSPDGRLLASGGEDHTVRLWNIAQEKEQAVLQNHRDPVYGVTFSHDGALLASASWDRSIRIWRVNDAKELRRLEGHQDAVVDVAFSPKDALLASASHDKSVMLWDVKTGRPMLNLAGHEDGVTGVAFSSQGDRLATSSRDRQVRVWALERKQPQPVLLGHQNWIYGLSLSPDGTQLASAGWDGLVNLWQLGPSPKLIKGFSDTGASAFCVAFSPDGQLIAFGGEDGTIHVKRRDGAPRAVLKAHAAKVYALVFVPKAQDPTLVSAGWDGKIHLWNLSTNKRERTFRFGVPKIYGLAISPKGDLLAVAGQKAEVQLLNPKTGAQVASLPHKSWTSGVTFSPDGTLLATSGKDGLIRLYSIPKFEAQAPLEGHSQWVNQVHFSKHGRWLVSASDDRSVRLWDVRSRTQLLKFNTEGPAVTAAFSPTDNRLAVAEYARIRLFPIPMKHRDPQVMLREAEADLGRKLKGLLDR